MIPRYTRPEMAAIWSPESKFRIMFEIEAHATFALADDDIHVAVIIGVEQAHAVVATERTGFELFGIS